MSAASAKPAADKVEPIPARREFRGHFGWEYKGKHKDLAAAYGQLLLYREALENPPLLVVCDLDRFEIHTNFTGTAKRVYAFDLDHLAELAHLDTRTSLAARVALP